MQDDSLELTLKAHEKQTSSGKAYYWYSDIQPFLGKGAPSASSFRRRISEGKIQPVVVEGQEEAAYLAQDIQKFLRGELNKPRGGARRNKTQKSVRKSITATTAPTPLMGKASPDDLPHIFFMEYEQIGMNATSPHTIMSWLKKNSEVYWILSNPIDRHDIWVTLAILPLTDQIIHQLLSGKMSLNDIQSDSIQAYRPNQNYSCYLSAICHPEHKALLPLLIRHVFSYWCEQPYGTIKNLYTLIHDLENPIWQIIKEFYFSPLYNFSTF